MRALLRRLRGQEAGFTFVEVIASVVILGIIMVPLGTAMVFAYRTVFGIQDRLANTADVQRLSTYFPSDVASVDADGVNPARVEDESICKATATEQSLITFRWDEDLGDGGQTVVRYVATGNGKQSKVVRRICRGSDAPVETVLAKNFGEGTGAGAPEASTYLTDPDHTDLPPTPVCGTTSCYIDIHGAYDFHLEAQRRVEGDDGSNHPPGAPTSVHALGGFQRARLYWLDPVDTGGLPITGYYIEQNGNGATSIVGGATPTLFPPGSGTTGALIPNLTNNQGYYFRVRAVTAVGNGPWSENSNSVTPGPTTPEPPSLDAAAGDPATSGRITASWSLASDYSDGGSALTGFKLTALSPDATPATVTYGDPNARSGAVTGLTDNTKYKVQVTALNSYGEGSPSPVPITALTRPGAPGTPTAGATGVAGSVTLNFTLPTGGDVADLTNVRAKIGATFSTPVDVPTACPDQQNCSITVTGVNVTSATTITVEAQNATGWGPDSGSLVIPADTSPPTVAITFPTNPQYGTAAWNAGCSNAGGAICGTASDNFPGAVANVTVTVKRSSDNRYWNGSAGTGTSQWSSTSPIILTATGTTTWQQALTTASLQNGVTYTVTAQAKDTVNLPSTVVTKTFAYVTGAPTATLTAPASNANVGGNNVTVSGNAGATSPATVASAEFQYSPHNAGTWTSIVVDTVTPYTTPWDTTALADGSYDLRMIVTDSAGNSTTSSTRTVTVDNNPPTGSITAPANGAYVHGSSVSVTSNSADTGSGVANAVFQYKPTAGVTWTQIGAADTTSPYGVSWNTTGLADGSYDLRVITTDNVGLQFTSPVISVLSDNTNPTIGAPVVTGTLGNNGWYTSNVNVTWPAPTDAAGIASTTGCGPTNITANTTGTLLTCSATDNAGNTASNSVTIKRDATAPTGSITNPNDGDSVTGTVTVSSNSADGTSGVANATYQYSPAGANTWTTIGTDAATPYQTSWNTGALADGNYDLRVITTDNAGLTFTSATITVYLDRTPPTVTITFPSNPQYGATAWNAGCSGANGAVCGTAADGFGTVQGVTVTIRRSSDNRYWNGTAGTGTGQWSTGVQNLSTTGTTSWSRVFTTASLQNNVTYTIVATATDSVGLTGTDTQTFAYLTTAPTAALTAPTSGTNVQGTITVSGNGGATSPATVVSAEFQYAPHNGSTWTSIAVDTVTPYTTPWNTTAVGDGSYDLRMIVTDSAGNSTTSSIRTVTVDNNAPTGSITAPTNGSYATGSVSVTSNSADAGSGVANAVFQYKPTAGVTWTQIGAADTTSPYGVSWNTAALGDGSYDLRVITTDNVGLQFTSPVISVLVDNTNPTIGAPVVTGTLGANGWYTSNVNVTWPAPTDAAGIASTTGCGPTNITANTTGTLLTCSATDNAGNTASNSITIKRDANAPTGNLTAPTNGASVTGNVTVSSDSADTGGSGVANATYQYSPAGTNTWTTIAADTSSPYSVSWNTAPVADGNYDLRVVTTDNAGLQFTSATRTVFVDDTPPSVTITFPADGSAYNTAGWAAGCVTNDVCGTANDGAGTVASVTLTIRRSDGRYWNGSPGTSNTQWPTSVQTLTVNGTTAWNRAFTTTSLSSGSSYTVMATATDGVGLTGTATNVFAYDTAAPSGTVTAPANGAFISGTVNVTSNSADTGGAGVASAVFEYRVATTGAWTTIGTDTSSPYSVPWDTTSVPEGQYYLHVITTDNAGNMFTSGDTADRVRVDNTNPTGAITAPANGVFVKGNAVTVSSNSADAGSGVANATFQRSPAGANTWTTIATDATSPYSVSWNTTSLTDGSYDLQVITTDNAGNSFTSPVVTVKVDNNAPSIVANATGTVGSNGWYTTNVGLTWTVTDAFAPLTLTNCGPQSVTSDTSSFSFTCSATDPAGNSSNGTFSGKRDATAPTASLTAPADGAYLRGNSVAMTGTGTDATSGVASVAFQRSPAGTNTWTTIGSDTSSPYTATWNTTSATPDGDYDVRTVTTDNAGLQTASAIITVTVDNTKPTVTSMSLSGPSGAAGNGQVGAGDQVRIVFSEPIDVSTMCSTWSGDTSDQSTSLTVTMKNNNNSDYLTLPSPCTNIATGTSTNIDTNANYVGGDRTFTGSTVVWSASSRTLTITLGAVSGGSTNTGVGSAAPAYTPTGNVADLAGNTLTTNASGTSSRF